MSENGPVPTESRAERALMRALGALAVMAWPAVLALIAARATHTLRLSEATFGVLTSWGLSTACLGIVVYAMRDDAVRAVRLLAHLDIGNPNLDELLCAARPPWRARPSVRLAFTATAAASWVTAIAYSIQIALGVYKVPAPTEILLLRWMLAAAVCSSVIVATMPAKCRYAAALELVAAAHRAQRDKRDRLDKAVAGGAGETGEIPRLGDGGGDVIDYAAERSRRGRYGAG